MKVKGWLDLLYGSQMYNCKEKGTNESKSEEHGTFYIWNHRYPPSEVWHQAGSPMQSILWGSTSQSSGNLFKVTRPSGSIGTATSVCDHTLTYK